MKDYRKIADELKEKYSDIKLRIGFVEDPKSKSDTHFTVTSEYKIPDDVLSDIKIRLYPLEHWAL